MTTSGPQPSPWATRVGSGLDRLARLPSRVKQALACFGSALVVAAIGYVALMAEPKPDAVDCDGRAMSRGDICEEYSEPGHVLVDTKTYDEVWQGIRDGNILIGRIGLAIAVILVVVGIVQLAREIRSARAR